MKIAFFTLLSVLLFACNPTPEETVDFDDLSPDSEKYGKDSLDKPVEKKLFYFDSITPLSQI